MYLISQDEQWIGRARVAHAEQQINLMEHYGFQFVGKPRTWVVR